MRATIRWLRCLGEKMLMKAGYHSAAGAGWALAEALGKRAQGLEG